MFVKIHAIIIQIPALSYSSPTWHPWPVHAPLHEFLVLSPSSQPSGHSPVFSLQGCPGVQWHGFVQDKSLPNRQPSMHKMQTYIARIILPTLWMPPIVVDDIPQEIYTCLSFVVFRCGLAAFDIHMSWRIASLAREPSRKRSNPE